MNTQIYLLLVKKMNPHLPKTLPLMLKNAILGDSLDVPFLKLIRVKSINQQIEFEGETELTEVRNGALNVVSTSGNSVGSYADASGGNRHANGGRLTSMKANSFANLTLPSHSAFSFTKWLDNATPCLLYTSTVIAAECGFS